LYKIHIAFHRDHGLLVRLDAFKDHKASGLMEERDDSGHELAHVIVSARFLQHGAVKLYDIGLHAPNALEVALTSSKIVNRNPAPEIAKALYGASQLSLAGGFLLDNLDDDTASVEPRLLEPSTKQTNNRCSVWKRAWRHIEEKPTLTALLGELIEVLTNATLLHFISIEVSR
jgi:hypothetical protein